MAQKIFEVRGDQAAAVLQAFKGVATDEGSLPLHEIHRRTLTSIGEHLLAMSVDVASLPADFADVAAVITDEDLRREITHMAAVLPYLAPEFVGRRCAALERLAKLWGISDLTVKGALAFAQGSKTLIYLDSFRSNRAETGKGLAALSWGFFKSALHLDGDAKTLARYESYRALPIESLGRTLVAYYDDNRFALPGSTGSPFSNNLTMHDRHHVLAGYDTTPLGELCVFAFDGALSHRDFSSAMVGIVAQFQLGYVFDPSIRAWRHQFDPEMVYRAAERGHGCKINYLDDPVDLDRLMDKPLREVREYLGIAPEGGLVAQAGDRWCGAMGPVDDRQSPDIAEEGLLKFN